MSSGQYIDVPIKREQYEQLAEASIILGCSVPALLNEAVAEYLECTAAPYVQGVLERSAGINVTLLP